VNLVYRTVKGIIDQSARLVSERLPLLRATEVKEALPPVRAFSPAAPLNIASLPEEFARFFREELDFPATHIFILHRVTVSWHAVIMRNLRLFLPALAAPHWKQFYNDSYLLKQWFSRQVVPEPEQGPLALVHDQWTRRNYYHWMVDALPRLLVLRDYDPNAWLIMPEPMPAYIEQTAQLLGFKNFVRLKEGEVIQADVLLVPERVAPLGYHNPDLVWRLRKELSANVLGGPPTGTPSRRIFVSRSRQHLRRLANETEILEVLERYGFECVYFEETSFAEQVLLMHSTAILIGVHGANLVNLLFMQKGAQVVELMNEDKFSKLGNANFENLIYYRMSTILELSYFAVPCQTAPEQLPSNDADIVVEAATVSQLMQQLLGD
jgi:hypothetical protein